MVSDSKEISIVDATVDELQGALKSGRITAVELVAKHLLRIAQYDRRGPTLNSIPIINQNVFEDAQVSDDSRAARNIRSALEGLPYTVKDSYRVKGMTVASGSPAFQKLVATDDAFTVSQLRKGGGIFLGLTNMPPMAAGGMQRGVYGRAESPYSADYLTAAFGSGSSNGSGTATAASFAVIGMAEETLSSGRSPASNNALVAYTPSRGILSIRGNWPLFSNCDVVVPHTRTVDDMFSLLDVIAAKDHNAKGDFWREQPFVKLPDVDSVRPKSYHDLADTQMKSLVGKKLGVPKMYIGEEDSAAVPVHTRPSVRARWEKARQTLESLGATVEEVDFPIVTNFEKKLAESGQRQRLQTLHLTSSQSNDINMTRFMAYTWDDFLVENNDSAVSRITSLAHIDPARVFPRPPGSLPDLFPPEIPALDYGAMVDEIKKGRGETFDISGIAPTLKVLEDGRRVDFEEWLVARGLDAVVWPCQGDVGRADADCNEEAQRDAWRNGVRFSNGNFAIRHFGIPTVSVPMGEMADTGMPVNLTFAAATYHDNELFRYASAFEAKHRGRTIPGRTPKLPTDTIGTKMPIEKGGQPPAMIAKAKRLDNLMIQVSGSIQTHKNGLKSLEVFVDGVRSKDVDVAHGMWSVTVEAPSQWTGRPEEINVPDPKLAMVVVLAITTNGRATGKLLFV